MSTSSIELSDDGSQFGEIPSNGESIGRRQLRAMGINPSEPSAFSQSLVKLANTTFSAATVSLLRAWASPPVIAPLPDAETLPPWYVEEYNRKSRYSAMTRQYARDTALLIAASYIMDWGEAGMRAIRGGKDDPLNKTMGGVAAGGLVGYTWFRTNPRARAVMTSTGALVGYLTYAVERTNKNMLLEQQQKLEMETLGLDDGQLSRQLDPSYLRELIRLRQKQLADSLHTRQQQEGGQLVPSWVQQGASGAANGGRPFIDRGLAASGVVGGNRPGAAGSDAGLGPGDDTESSTAAAGLVDEQQEQAEAGFGRAPAGARGGASPLSRNSAAGGFDTSSSGSDMGDAAAAAPGPDERRQGRGLFGGLFGGRGGQRAGAGRGGHTPAGGDPDQGVPEAGGMSGDSALDTGGGGGGMGAGAGATPSVGSGTSSRGYGTAAGSSTTGGTARGVLPTVERRGGGELVIREEPDLPRNADGFKEAADALVIKEEQDTPAPGRRGGR